MCDAVAVPGCLPEDSIFRRALRSTASAQPPSIYSPGPLHNTTRLVAVSSQHSWGGLRRSMRTSKSSTGLIGGQQTGVAASYTTDMHWRPVVPFHS